MHQRILDNQVGRRTDKRHHASHAACKGKRHQQTSGIHARICGKAYYDGQHQGYRSRIAHKSPDSRSDQHDQQEQPQLAFSGKFQDARTNHLRQPGLKDSAAYYKQPYHHNHHRIGKAR